MKLINNKLFYYISNFLGGIVPSFYLRFKYRLYRSRNFDLDAGSIARVKYYVGLKKKCKLGVNATKVGNFKVGSPTAYFLDLKKLIRYFPKTYQFNFLFGDVVHVPDEPTFVKSRPIVKGNANSVLLKLNSFRHFKFIDDDLSYASKLNKLVWRGNIQPNQKSRIDFFKQHFSQSNCNIGHVNSFEQDKWKRERLSIKEQLEYKFILSIEGNDVATNLKWIMSSNSIAVMPTPKYETWFMEGKLIPDYHYIHLKEDFSDLDEKLNYYISNPEKALEIVSNANEFVRQFTDRRSERLIALAVLDRYFELTGIKD